MTCVSGELNFVGIDVSKDTVDVSWQEKKVATFANDDRGAAEILKRLNDLPGKIGAVVLEATGGYERALAVTLCQADLPVMVVNPRQAREFAKAMGHLAKTDAIDAQVLREFAHTLYHSARRERLLMKLPDAHRVELQAMMTRRSQLVTMRVAEANRLTNCHKSQRKSIQAVLKVIDKQLGAIDGDIERMMREHFQEQLKLIQGCPGVGPATQAVLIGALPELGELNHKQISKLVGVAPLNNDSGKHSGKRTTWGGRSDIRSILYMATLSAIRFNDVIKKFYQRLCTNGKCKKVAIVACMHKLLVILNAIVKSGKPWDPEFAAKNA